MENKRFRKSKFRINRNIRLEELIPLSLRSVGHYCELKGWQENPNSKNFFQFFWIIEGEAEIKKHNELFRMSEEYAVFFAPSEQHHIRVTSEYCRYRWFTCDGSVVQAIIEGFDFSSVPFYAGKCPEHKFTAMHESLLDFTTEGYRLGAVLVFDMLSILKSGYHVQSDGTNFLAKKYIELVDQNYGDPAFNINTAAEILQCHRTTLDRAVIKAEQISPSEYLTLTRIQKSIDLLKNTTMKVGEISKQCGFSQAPYFSKVIRDYTGHSPLNIRQM